MKKKSIILAFGLLPTLTIFSQDISFSQTAGNNVSINPALAGNGAHARLSTNYRNQWSSLNGKYSTTSTNFYQYIPKLNAYGGVTFTNENNAVIKNTTGSIFYSQNITIGEVLIRPAIEVGFASRSIDLNKITFGDMVDVNQNTIYSTGDQLSSKKNYTDVNAGAIVYYKNFLLGFSAHHINTPNTSFDMNGFETRLPTKFGTQFSFSHTCNKIGLSPYLTYNYQNGFNQTRVGLRVIYNNHINLALAVQNKDGFIANLGYQSKLFSLNYSYDVTASRLNNGVNGGSHEVSLFVNFWNVKTTNKVVEINSIFN